MGGRGRASSLGFGAGRAGFPSPPVTNEWVDKLFLTPPTGKCYPCRVFEWTLNQPLPFQRSMNTVQPSEEAREDREAELQSMLNSKGGPGKIKRLFQAARSIPAGTQMGVPEMPAGMTTTDMIAGIIATEFPDSA